MRPFTVRAARWAFLAIAWLPVAWLLAESGKGGGGAGLGTGLGVGEIVWGRVAERAWTTLWLSAASAAASLLAGAALALGLGRLALPGRRIWIPLLCLPLLIPTYVWAIGAIQMLGGQGWMTRALGLTSAPIYSGFGVWGVLTLSYMPIVAFSGWALGGWRGAAEEEWALLHASASTVLLRVSLRRMFPGLLAGAGGVFLLCAAEFGIPEALRAYPVLSVEVYTQLGVYYNPRAGAAAGLLLAAMGAGAAAIFLAIAARMRAWDGDGGRAMESGRRDGRWEKGKKWEGGAGGGEIWEEREGEGGAGDGADGRLESGGDSGDSGALGMRLGWRARWGWMAAVIGLGAAPAILAAGTLFAGSFEGFSLSAWKTAWATGWDELLWSALLAGTGALGCVVLGWLCASRGPGYSLARSGGRKPPSTAKIYRKKTYGIKEIHARAPWIQALRLGAIFLPLALPAPVTASGWSRMLSQVSAWGCAPEAGALLAAAGRAAQYFLDTPIALWLAWMGRWTPLAMVLLSMGFRQIPREWYEAHAIEGGGRISRWLWIEAPMLARPALAAGGIIGCLLLGEAGAAILLLPPGLSTASVRLLTLMHYAPTPSVCAMALMNAAAGFLLLAPAAAAARRMGQATPFRRTR